MADGFWYGKIPPRSGSESSLSGTAPESALDLEAVGEDANVVNNSMITLVHIFSNSSDDNASLRVHQQLAEFLRCIRVILEKYKFDPGTKQEIMDRTKTIQQFVMTLDYKEDTKSLHDHLYALVDKLAVTLGAGFKSLLTGFDNACDPTPEITIERSKVASHYLKHLADFMEWRARLEMDYASKLSRQAEKYRTILSTDPYLPLQSTFVTSLEKTQEYAETLINAQHTIQSRCVEHILKSKNIHDEKRKKLKGEWKKIREGYNDSVMVMNSCKSKYHQAQEEHTKAQNRTREEEENLVAKKTPMAKVEKRQRQEEEAKDRMKHAEREYRQRIDFANIKQSEMTDKTSHTAKELQESLTRIDEVVRQSGAHYFSLQHSVLINYQSSLQSLRETAKSYQPGRQLAEYLRDSSPRHETEKHTQFQFTQTPYHSSHTLLAQHSSDSESDPDAPNPSKNSSKFNFRPRQKRQRLFGGPLAGAAKDQPTHVPFVISRLVQEIDARALTTKGIYRVNGVKNRVESICASFSFTSCSTDLSAASEHDMSSVLKRYLHDLPDPLLTHEHYPKLLDISKRIGELRKLAHPQPPASPNSAALKEIDRKTVELGHRLHDLPIENYSTLKLIIQHLGKVADNSNINMMGPKNLGTVFGPTLMRAGEDKGPIGCLIDVPDQSRLVDIMITNRQVCFPKNSFKKSADKQITDLEMISRMQSNLNLK